MAQCVCGKEYHRDPVADRRVRLDPLDPKTSQHAGECEFATVTDPAVLRVLLKVQEGAGGGYCGDVRWLRHRVAGSVLRRERQVTWRHPDEIRQRLEVGKTVQGPVGPV